MRNKKRTNQRHSQRGSRYTPPVRKADVYSFNDYGPHLPRIALGEPRLCVIQHPAKPEPEDVLGVLALFMAGENWTIVDSQVIFEQEDIVVHHDIEGKFETRLGLAHVLYLGEVNGITITFGHSDIEALDRFLAGSQSFLKRLLHRRGDSNWFRPVSGSAVMRAALDIARRSGLVPPQDQEMNEWNIELIRRRWTFGGETPLCDAVQQGLKDAIKITSRR
jgi:hypothetical protein